MIYYTVNTVEKRIYEDETDNALNEREARALIKEYTERINELEGCLQALDYSYGPDPMDIYKARIEAL